MHESALVYKILESIAPSLQPEYSLKSIYLEVGEYSCVNTNTLIRLFDLAKMDTFAKDSQLKLSVVKGDFDITVKSIEVTK